MNGDTVKNQVQILETQLDRLLGWIRASDPRLAFVVTLSTAMLSSIAYFLGSVESSKELSLWITCWIVITCLLLVVSIGCCMIAAFPKTKGPSESLIYFGRIDKLELNEYKLKLKSWAKEKYFDDLVAQCHRNAQIASIKYRWIQNAIIVLSMAAVPWMVSMFILRVGY